MKQQLKEKVVKVIAYYLECPYCQRDISGHDKKMALRNFKRHTIKCKVNQKKKEARKNEHKGKIGSSV